MTQQLSPGITSSERTPDVIAIEAVATDIGALQGQAEKGPIGVPTLITSPSQYTRIFGTVVSGSYLAESVRGFFENKGARLYIVRAGHYTDVNTPSTLDAVAATLMLQDGTPTNTLLVSMAWEGVAGNNYGVQVVLRDTTVTTLAVAIPFSPQTTAVLTSAARVSVGDTLYIDDTTNSIRFHVTAINGNTVTFVAQTPQVGIVASTTAVVLETFELVFYLNGTEIVRDTDLRMSPLAGSNYVENVTNRPDDPEYFFNTTDQAVAPTGVVDPRPDTLAQTAIGGTVAGSDGSSIVAADIVGSAAGGTGFYAFDAKRINLLAAPGWTDAVTMVGLETYLQSRAYTMGIIEPPIASTVSGAITWLGTTVNVSDDHLAVYYPWPKVFDFVNGIPLTVPPSGLVMGRYANVARQKNTAKSPAGIDDGKLLGVIGVERELSGADYDTLYPVKINGILKKPNGITIMGDKTLGAVAKALKFVNRRRTQDLIIQSVNEGTEWVLFENNDDETRARFTRSVGAFLLGLWKGSVLDGTRATDAFYVICNGDNNPATLVAQGKFKARIGARHKKSINFAEYEYEQDTRAEQAELAAAGL